MVAAAILARDRFDADLFGVHKNVLDAARLPRHAPNVDVGRALAAIGEDGKRAGRDGRAAHRFVLLESIRRTHQNIP